MQKSRQYRNICHTAINVSHRVPITLTAT